MTLHLIALPHTRVSEEFVGCAYTSKSLKFTKMMRGHFDVVLYAPEGSTNRYTAETVEVLSDAERVSIFGEDDPARLPEWPGYKQASSFNANAARELRKRWEPGDLVLLTGGLTQQAVIEQGPEGALYCEPGVGYEGIATGFCAFESKAWRHYVYAKREIVNGRWFDAVIPNYFDVGEFGKPLREGGDYLLFLGRVVPRKGPHVALEIAEACGLPLVVAGAGAEEVAEGLVVAGVGGQDEVRLEGNVRYLGPVGIEERGILLAGARALLCPTLYIEPFGGVAVEAMLSGTPAISTDWGAFTETIEQGVTGFRFSTLREGIEAVERCVNLSPFAIRSRSAARFSLEAVAPLFVEWFERLDLLRGNGWYEMSSPAAKIRG